MDRTQLRILIYSVIAIVFVLIVIFVAVYEINSKRRIKKIKDSASTRSDISVRIDLLKRKINIKGWYQDYEGYIKKFERNFDFKEIGKYYSSNDKQTQHLINGFSKEETIASLSRKINSIAGENLRIFGTTSDDHHVISNLILNRKEKEENVVYGIANEIIYKGKIADNIKNKGNHFAKTADLQRELRKISKSKRRFGLTRIYLEPTSRIHNYPDISLDVIISLFNSFLRTKGHETVLSEEMNIYIISEYIAKDATSKMNVNRQKEISEALAEIYTEFANEIGISTNSNHLKSSTFFFFNEPTTSDIRKCEVFFNYSQFNKDAIKQEYLQRYDVREQIEKYSEIDKRIFSELRSNKIDIIQTIKTSKTGEKYTDIALNIRNEEYRTLNYYSSETRIKVVKKQLEEAILVARRARKAKFITVFDISLVKIVHPLIVNIPQNLTILFSVGDDAEDFIYYDYIIKLKEYDRSNIGYGLIFNGPTSIVNEILSSTSPAYIFTERRFRNESSDDSSTEFDHAQVKIFARDTANTKLIELE